MVIDSIPRIVKEIIVVDNCSNDDTSIVAKSKNAIVLHENQKGYGYACLKGIKYLKNNPPDIVVFLDGDYSDYPEDLIKIVNPIIEEKVVFCVGTRSKNLRE